LAAAQYRVGRDADALATLGRCEPLNQDNDDERAIDLALAVMAHQRLRQKAEAAAALAQLREAMTKGAARTDEARTLQAEAEALVAP
jgi:hypothetical protein